MFVRPIILTSLTYKLCEHRLQDITYAISCTSDVECLPQKQYLQTSANFGCFAGLFAQTKYW